MAKWRAIWKKIAVSGQVNRMSEFAQFLFERAMLPADDWGVVTGDPWELKAEAMPLSRREPEEFEAALVEMEEQGLIWRYEPPGYGALVQFIKWDEYQPAVLIGNRTDPKKPLHYLHPDYEEYPDLYWKILENTGKDCNREEVSMKSSKSKSKSKSESNSNSLESESEEKRKEQLKHPAIRGYRELARLHVPIPLREDWIACAEELGTDVLLAFTKEWIGNGWNRQNVNGIMEYARKGGKGGPRKQVSRRTRQEAGTLDDEFFKKLEGS